MDAHHGESKSSCNVRELYLKLRPHGRTHVFDEVEYYNDEVDGRNYTEFI
jgi:hypothetical protein